jgi:hypothetical protein
MSKPWAQRRTMKDRLSTVRFVVMGTGFTVALVVTIGVEDAGRAAVGLIRRTLP